MARKRGRRKDGGRERRERRRGEERRRRKKERDANEGEGMRRNILSNESTPDGGRERDAIDNIA